MSSCESTLRSAAKYLSIAIVTFAIATGGTWLTKRPLLKDGPSTFLKPANWMSWVTGRDVDKELRDLTPLFDPRGEVSPAWESDLARSIEEVQANSNRVSEEITRSMEEMQAKNDRLLEEIGAFRGLQGASAKRHRP